MSNKKNTALVSIIIPVYNHERFIHESVTSALNQIYDNIEVIVIDDGSTDNTSNVLKEFEDRILYIRQENRGTAASLNRGIQSSAGTFIAWLSSDDVFLPQKIQMQIELFEKEQSLDLVYTDWIMIDADGKEIKVVRHTPPLSGNYARSIIKGNFINGSSVLLRKECFHQAGYFDESLVTDSDGDMWLRLLKHSFNFGHVSMPLLKYRWHSGNLSRKSFIHNSYKDIVRTKAIKTYGVEELFGDLVKDNQFKPDSAYADLASFLTRKFLFKSAKSACTKSIQYKISMKNIPLLIFVLSIGLKPVTFILFWCRSFILKMKKSIVRRSKRCTGNEEYLSDDIDFTHR